MIREAKLSLHRATYVLTDLRHDWEDLKVGEKFCLDNSGKLIFVKASNEYAISLDTEELWHYPTDRYPNYFRVISFDTTGTRNSDSK